MRNLNVLKVHGPCINTPLIKGSCLQITSVVKLYVIGHFAWSRMNGTPIQKQKEDSGYNDPYSIMTIFQDLAKSWHVSKRKRTCFTIQTHYLSCANVSIERFVQYRGCAPYLCVKCLGKKIHAQQKGEQVEPHRTNFTKRDHCPGPDRT